jgi:HlyD family secretion protein
MKMNRFTAMLVLAFLATAVASWLVARPISEPAATVQLVPNDSAARAVGVGYVDAPGEVRRLGFRCGGVISRCLIKPGSYVKAGEVIAELDQRVLEAAVHEADASVALAKANLEQLEAGEHPQLISEAEHALARVQEELQYLRNEATRLSRLSSQLATTQSALEAINSQTSQAEKSTAAYEAKLAYSRTKIRPQDLDVARMSLRLAEARADAARRRQSEAVLTAPFDGVVLRYLKLDGEPVSAMAPAEPAVLFARSGPLQVRAEVDERFASAAIAGCRAEIYGRNLRGKRYSAKVITVRPVMGNKTVFSRSVEERKDLEMAEVFLEPDDQLLAPIGLQVDVSIELPNANTGL